MLNDKTKTFGILEARKSELEKIIEHRAKSQFEGLDADGITKGKKHDVLSEFGKTTF